MPTSPRPRPRPDRPAPRGRPARRPAGAARRRRTCPGSTRWSRPCRPRRRTPRSCRRCPGSSASGSRTDRGTGTPRPCGRTTRCGASAGAGAGWPERRSYLFVALDGMLRGHMPYLFETEDHAAIRASARRFAQAHIAPRGAEWEEAEEFPVELYRTAAAAGITGVGYPEAIGGQGGDLGHVLVACDELVLAGRSVGTLVGLGSHGIALPPIVRFGTPDQIRRFVTPCLRDGKISALAITEPGGGSDVASLATRAERDGDDYIVTGAKTFITSGTRADFVTTAVRTGGPGHAGISLLVIERGTPGFAVTGKLRKTGWWASDTAELRFDGCRVPAPHRIGPADGAFPTIMMNFPAERLGLAGQCVAIAELAYRESSAYG